MEGAKQGGRLNAAVPVFFYFFLYRLPGMLAKRPKCKKPGFFHLCAIPEKV